MFEIIKIFVEQVFRLLDVKSIIDSRRDSKLSDIGADLFSLYSSLNRIYLCGLRVISEIKTILRKRDQYEEEKRLGDRMHGFGLQSLLLTQRQNLIDFSHAFDRLSSKLEVIDPKSSRDMIIFLATKSNLIIYLIEQMQRGRGSVRSDHQYDSVLFSPSAEKEIKELIAGFNSIKPVSRHRSLRLRMGRDESALPFPASDEVVLKSAKKIKKEEGLESFESIPTDRLHILKKYLEERKPDEKMEDLRKILEGLYESLARSFEVKDILLKVGDRREMTESYPANWRPNRLYYEPYHRSDVFDDA